MTTIDSNSLKKYRKLRKRNRALMPPYKLAQLFYEIREKLPVPEDHSFMLAVTPFKKSVLFKATFFKPENETQVLADISPDALVFFPADISHLLH